MWTYNVTRALYKSCNVTVVPERVPKDESTLISEALQSRDADGMAYCIKTHLKIPNPVPTQHEVKLICNIRDVRDACLSYKRFMHSDFETCLGAMKDMMLATDYYMQTFHDNLLAIRFDELSNENMAPINKISAFLELPATAEQKKQIWNTFRKSSVKGRLDKLSNIVIDHKGQLKGPENQNRYDTVRNHDGTYRIFEKETSFQTNHITSNRDGEWRTHFSNSEIEKILDLSSDWLQRYNYAI